MGHLWLSLNGFVIHIRETHSTRNNIELRYETLGFFMCVQRYTVCYKSIMDIWTNGWKYGKKKLMDNFLCCHELVIVLIFSQNICNAVYK